MPVLALLAPSGDGPNGPPATQQKTQPSQLPKARQVQDDDWRVLFVVDPRKWGNQPADFKPLKLGFPTAADQLSPQLDQALQSAYAAYGLGGVDRFAVGVFGLAQYGEFVMGTARWRFSTQTQKGDDLVAYLHGQVPVERRDLWTAFEAAYKKLRALITTTRDNLRTAALQRFLHVELPLARAGIIRETRRYLSVSPDSDEGAVALLKAGGAMAHTELLYGPEGPRLLEVLRALVPYANRMHDAEDQAAALGWRKNLAGKAAALPALGGLAPLVLLGILALPRADALDTATQRLAAARQSFTDLLTTWVPAYPILYRLLDTKTSVDDAAAVALTLTADLQDAWNASVGVAAGFKSEPDLVWTLPTLLDRTIKFGFKPKRDFQPGLTDWEKSTTDSTYTFAAQAAFAEQVAAGEVAALNNAVSILDCINTVIQVVDVSTTLIQPEFPVLEVVLAIAGALAGIASLVKEYVSSEPQRLASRAAIDQSHSVSSASPYMTLLIKTVLRSLILAPLTPPSPSTSGQNP